MHDSVHADRVGRTTMHYFGPGVPVCVGECGVVRGRSIGPLGVLRTQEMSEAAFLDAIIDSLYATAGDRDVCGHLVRLVRIAMGDARAGPDRGRLGQTGYCQ